MDIFSRINDRADEIRGEFGEKDAAFSRLFSGSVLSGNIPPSLKASDYLKASSGFVYACASAIADEIASIRIRLYKGQKDDEIEEITDHPALDILQRANSFTTQFDHFWMTTQYLELTGEAPWFVSSEDGVPKSLVLLRPDLLSIKQGKGDAIIDHYEYRVGGINVPLKAEEVVFLRYPDPNKMWRGKGPLQAAAKTVDIEDFSEEYNRKFFYNSARPDGILSTEQKLGRDQMTTLERKLANKYKGLDNAHKTLILEKGLKWEPMGLSQKDMEFLEGSRFSRDKILAIFRVPRTVLGITDDVNRANAEATDYVFIKRTIKPKMERIVQQLNEFLLPLFPDSEELFYDFDDPVPNDVLVSLETKKAALQFGWLSINEVRAMDGYEPIEGGDEIRVPVSNVPVGEEGLFGLGMKKNYGKRLASTKARNRDKIKSRKFKDALEKKVAQILIGNKKKKSKKKVVKDVEKADDPKALAFQEKQLNIADDYESKYAARVRKVFHKQRDAVLSKFGKSQKEIVNWRDFLLKSDEEKRRFIDELSPVVSSALVTQAREAFQFVGTDENFDADNPVIKDYLENRAFKFAKPTTVLTNKLLGRELRAGIAEGESIRDLRKRVEGVFSAMEKYRSERIARSETIRATNYASQEAYKASGVVTAKEWLTALDERTCSWCAPMNRRVTDLDDSWFEKGESFTGTDGQVIKLDYENVDHPPLHPNCRCTLVPVVLEGPAQGQWKPTMTEAQAEEFVSESKIRDTLFHGTVEDAADSIHDNGFNLARRGGTGGEIINGIYLTTDQASANDYAYSATGAAGSGARPAVLPVKINVNNVKTYSWSGLYDHLVDTLGSGFTSEQARAQLAKEGIDAIKVVDEINKQTYVAVFDSNSVVLIDKPDYSPN